MRFNRQQRVFLFTFAGFLLVCIIYEAGFYIIKGHTNFNTTPFIMTGALLATYIGIRLNRGRED